MGYENSCLMRVMWQTGPKTDAVTVPMLGLLLNAAAERGELGELLAIRDHADFGGSTVFHLAGSYAQLQTLLRALTSSRRAPLPEIFPGPIKDVIASFLPNPLNQHGTSGFTPIMSMVYDGRHGHDLPMVRLLVDAGADPNLGTPGRRSQTALDLARRRLLYALGDQEAVARLTPLISY